jgi:hypothetical protein
MSKVPCKTTRSGRKVKQPDKWVPEEDVTDDFKADEYDSDESSVTSSVEYSTDEDEDDDDDSFINDESDDDVDDDMFTDEDDDEYSE